MADLAGKKVFTTGEAAVVCNVSQQTIIRCFDSGRLQGFRVPGSRFRRIPREELMRFMKSNGIPLDALEGDRRRILVVDDDARIVDLFRDVLGEDERFEVTSAMTGYDAGLLTESFRPHLIVLDYLLPDLNGSVVLERIRAREDLAGTRIMLVSGVIRRDEIEGLLGAGADAFLQKPFDLDEFLKLVKDLLGLEASAG
ncbi:MAG: response regulator [Planctomycetota bacterium]